MDLSCQTAANTFINTFANTAGDLLPFSFAALLPLDPLLQSEPLTGFDQTFANILILQATCPLKILSFNIDMRVSVLAILLSTFWRTILHWLNIPKLFLK